MYIVNKDTPKSTQKPVIDRHRIESMGEVKTFLDSIERNSSQARRTYHLRLSYFQDFLDSRSLTLETILQPLIKNQIDLYELLDEFVAYLVILKPEVNLKF
jgi:predicted RecB family nuclease